LSHTGSRLILATGSRLAVADTEQGQVRPILEAATEITSAAFAPNDEWIAMVTGARVLAMRTDRPPDNNELVHIVPKSRELSTFAWAPSGNAIYFIGSLDDSRCVWGQRLQPETKSPIGKPYEVRHFGSEQGSLWPDSDIAAGGDLLALRLVRDQASIWIAPLK
jgi:hypothetical protein